VLVVGLFIAFIAVVALLSRRGAGSRVQITSCCSARPWPPTDLTDDPPRAAGSPQNR
jgi:hypothetical protein